MVENWLILLTLSTLFMTSIAQDTSSGNAELFCKQNHKESNLDLIKLCDIIKAEKFTLEKNVTIQEKKIEIQKTSKPSQTHVWGYGFLCVTIISFMSVIGVSFMPLMSKAFYDHLLTFFIGLAVGSLSGSALFHLIPSAFKLADVSVDHSYLKVSLVIWCGVYLFFLIERFMKIFMESRSEKNCIPIGHSHHSAFTVDSEEEGPCHGK